MTHRKLSQLADDEKVLVVYGSGVKSMSKAEFLKSEFFTLELAVGLCEYVPNDVFSGAPIITDMMLPASAKSYRSMQGTPYEPYLRILERVKIALGQKDASVRRLMLDAKTECLEERVVRKTRGSDHEALFAFEFLLFLRISIRVARPKVISGLTKEELYAEDGILTSLINMCDIFKDMLSDRRDMDFMLMGAIFYAMNVNMREDYGLSFNEEEDVPQGLWPHYKALKSAHIEVLAADMRGVISELEAEKEWVSEVIPGKPVRQDQKVASTKLVKPDKPVESIKQVKSVKTNKPVESVKQTKLAKSVELGNAKERKWSAYTDYVEYIGCEDTDQEEFELVLDEFVCNYTGKEISEFDAHFGNTSKLKKMWYRQLYKWMLK